MAKGVSQVCGRTLAREVPGMGYRGDAARACFRDVREERHAVANLASTSASGMAQEARNS
jgi:hypothetical protein